MHIDPLENLHDVADRVVAHHDERAPKKPNGSAGAIALSEDADHYKIGTAYRTLLAQRHGVDAVYSLGALWNFDGGIWRDKSIESTASDVGAIFGGLKYCRRGSDFLQVARLVCALVEDDRFFEGAAAGIATPAGFWRIADDGEIVCEPPTPEHRQRMRLAVDPDFDTETPLLNNLLRGALGDDAQIELLQMAAGGALSRTLWRHKVAILLLGVSNSGKSKILQAIQAAFPNEAITSTSPQRWNSEYYVAALSGKALNVVGELEKQDPIPGGAFKNVVGAGDAIQGRNPTHRPFTFTPTTAHFFNANGLPPTADRSDAFFNRWRILKFEHEVPAEKIDPKYGEKIIAQELGGVVAWMLRGAAKLARAGSLPEPRQHRDTLLRWRVSNNSALQFLLDPLVCTIDPDLEASGQELFFAYQRWASEAGVRPFGRNGFYEAIEEGGGRIGVMRKTDKSGRVTVILGAALASATP